MKFNKWTLGLAAVGVVSLAAAAQAQEKSSSYLESAVEGTTISGYVSTSVHWDPGTGNGNVPGYAFNTPAKADGFNLDVVSLALEKPLDESEWASGYKVEVLYGPDANALGTTPIGGLAATDFAIKQAYVTVRTPIGNGIDWKLGVFDTVIGYESFDAGSDPNYTRSYGYSIEPTTHTGLLGTYRVADWMSVSAGIANTTGPIIGGANLGGGLFPVSAGRANPYKAESYKTYMGSIALTAPDNWGFLSGSTLYAGVVNGFNGGATVVGDQVNLYAGATLATPVTGLRLGIAYDYYGLPAQTLGGGVGPVSATWGDVIGLYASYQATEKLSFHTRGEYVWQDKGGGPLSTPSQVFGLTGTIQYDLWKNVLSRLEIRWDHSADGSKAYGGPLLPASGSVGGVGIPTGINAGVAGSPSKRNNVLIAANLIYKF
jgi:hypothetical protein